MKVLVAGATGAIGRPLVRELVQRGHDVHGLSRDAERAGMLGKTGATGHVCDALDAARVRQVVAAVRPDAVVAQLTQLPQAMRPRQLKDWYARNDRVRYEGTKNLLEAAEENGVRHFVAQSAAFWYAPTPGAVKSEDAPLWAGAPEPIGEAVRTMQRTEAMVQASPLRTVLLRYATFYGPGTWYSRDGQVGQMLRKRQYPVLGRGDGVWSLVHVEDAAAATVAAVERDVSGVFNVSDDEPATAAEWTDGLAAALGAPRPMRVPVWVGRLAMGGALTTYLANTRGADNAQAKRALGWAPRFPSWREGFQSGL